MRSKTEELMNECTQSQYFTKYHLDECNIPFKNNTNWFSQQLICASFGLMLCTLYVYNITTKQVSLEYLSTNVEMHLGMYGHAMENNI